METWLIKNGLPIAMFDYGGIRRTMVDFHGVTEEAMDLGCFGVHQIFRDMIWHDGYIRWYSARKHQTFQQPLGFGGEHGVQLAWGGTHAAVGGGFTAGIPVSSQKDGSKPMKFPYFWESTSINNLLSSYFRGPRVLGFGLIAKWLISKSIGAIRGLLLKPPIVACFKH